MPTLAERIPKSKVTVTLSPELLRQLDTLVQASESGSRSQLVEEALQLWLRDQAQKELEHQTEEYYRSLSKAERKEDRQWNKTAVRTAKRLWNE